MRTLMLRALALVVTSCSVFAQTQTADQLSQIRRLPFARVENAVRSDSAYPEISEFLQLIRQYERGANAVRSYHDPVLTRGARGIALFRSASPAVVLVVVGRVVNDKFDPTGEGTGVIVDSSGYVLTNWHVIRGANAGMIFMKPSSGDDLDAAPAFIAQLVYSNPTQDLALLKMRNAPQNLPFLRLANVSQVQVAEDIHIIGHPHGKYWSYSTGVVSQVRSGFTWSYSDGSPHRAKVLQMQTAINPGNSGGPVLDDDGAILGLVAMSEEGQNLNYAVAVDEIASFMRVGMASTTRGVTRTAPSPTPTAIFSARDKQGHNVTKLAYPELELYVVEDDKHAPLRVYVETKDGVTLSAHEPNAISGFNLWVATLPGGETLVGTGASGRPEKIMRQKSVGG
ncbi:MAG: S1C family serine protease [Terriglobales bacterium]